MSRCAPASPGWRPGRLDPVGGDILLSGSPIPAGAGFGAGQLGREGSAQAALSWSSRPRASASPRCSTQRHPHHVPRERPKDGPSARSRCSPRRLIIDRPHRQQRHRDDRRDQPARPRAAGRRHQERSSPPPPARRSRPKSRSGRITRRSRRRRAACCASSGPSGSRTSSPPRRGAAAPAAVLEPAAGSNRLFPRRRYKRACAISLRAGHR